MAPAAGFGTGSMRVRRHVAALVSCFLLHSAIALAVIFIWPGGRGEVRLEGDPEGFLVAAYNVATRRTLSLSLYQGEIYHPTSPAYSRYQEELQQSVRSLLLERLGPETALDGRAGGAEQTLREIEAFVGRRCFTRQVLEILATADDELLKRLVVDPQSAENTLPFLSLARIHPTAYREPVASAVYAIGLLTTPFVLESHRNEFFDALYTAREEFIDRIYPSLWVNAVLMGLLGAGIAALGCRLKLRRGLAFLASFAIWVFPSLYGELFIFGADLVVCVVALYAALFFVRCAESGSSLSWALAGGTLALLVLTSARFQFLLPLVLAALLLALKREVSLRRVAVFLMTYGVIVGGWMLRNYLNFGSFHVSQRGGLVLSLRAEHNRMDLCEYLTALGAWAKVHSAVALVSRIGSCGERSGMRLDEQNPDSFFNRGRRRRVELLLEEQSFDRHDRQLILESLGRISREPLRHLAMCIPLAVRAATFEQRLLARWLAYVGTVFMLVGFVQSIRKRDYGGLLFFLLPVFNLAFLILWTHCEPRYSLAGLPFILLSPLVHRRLGRRGTAASS